MTSTATMAGPAMAASIIRIEDSARPAGGEMGVHLPHRERLRAQRTRELDPFRRARRHARISYHRKPGPVVPIPKALLHQHVMDPHGTDRPGDRSRQEQKAESRRAKAEGPLSVDAIE